MKLRFSSLDVRVTAHELSKTLVGTRLQNIYDLSSRIFLFKFHKSSPSPTRTHIVLDTGFRIHTTSFSRATAGEPSFFVRRLRKILGTRRVTSVRQIGTDRILEIGFSDGQYKIYFEFYAAGNIIVTDGEQKVLAVQRSVDESGSENVKLGSLYTLEGRQNYNGIKDVDATRVKEMLERTQAEEGESKEAGNPKFKAKKGASQLRRAIGREFSEFPIVLLEHAMLKCGFDRELVPEQVLKSEELVEKLTEVLKLAQDVFKSVDSSDKQKSYIICKRKKDNANNDAESKLMYDEYQPFKPYQFEIIPDLTILEFDGFNNAVDEFYSSIEGQRLDSRLTEREQNAKKKLEESKKQHQERLGHLQQAQKLNIRKAEAIQANMERVLEATGAVNGLIAQGIDWVDMSRLIEAEQAKGNPVARTIKLPLKLHENTITLLLAEANADDDDDDVLDTAAMSETDDDSSDSDEHQSRNRTTQPRQQQDTRLSIDINLSLTGWANASQYYDQKKVAAEKHDRTEQSSSLALRNAERKITADLKKGLSQEKEVLRPLRQSFWFEKFYYFLSSDGFLVLAGKDPNQTEMLYRRYFKPGDVFVNADIQGGIATFIKNNDINSPVPPSTVSQAGNFAVAGSSAWDSKALMAAYWVKFEQVSKISPAGGDLLPLGNFAIKGEKNYLPPAQLLVGIGILFGISEESKKNHTRNRILSSEAIPDAAIVAPIENVGVQDSQTAEKDEDSDEDFPDTAAPVPSYDSDEDFPDVNPIAATQSDDEDELPASNPLQSITQVPKSQPKEETNSETPSAISTAHRHLSAKQRRLLKKGLPSTQNETESKEDDSDSDATSMTTTTLNTAAAANSNALLPRGKRTKLKKAKLKYAEQDEDDRAEALARLGSRVGDDRREVEAKERQAKLAQEEAERERQRRRKEENQKRFEEERKRVAAGTEEVREDSEEIDMSIVSRLTGRPHSLDEINFALPVCAPWTSLANFKYKVKLQPGMIKKGKAAREVLGKWQAESKIAKAIDPSGQDSEKMWPREVQLIQGLKDTEFIGTMIVGKVRIVMAGGSDGGKGNVKGGKGKGGSSGGKAGKKK